MATTSNLSIDNNNHKQKAYSINIHCANCAAKIERKINELSDVDNATISILTKQLTLTAKNPDELLPTIQKIADKIEPGTIITQLEENASNYKEKIYLIENYAKKQGQISLYSHVSVTAKKFFLDRGYIVNKEQYVEKQNILFKNYIMEKFL